MGMMSFQERAMLRARIYDLSERAAKEVLYDIVEVVYRHPGFLGNAFMCMLEDGDRAAKFEIKSASKEEMKAFWEGR